MITALGFILKMIIFIFVCRHFGSMAVPKGVIAMMRKKVVHVPKIIPAPESPHAKIVPKIIQQESISQQHDEMVVEERIAAEKAKVERLASEKAEEMFFMWKRAEEEKKATEAAAAAEKDEEMQLFVDGLFDEMEQIVEVPVPMTQEEIVPEPNIQEEIVHMANIQEEIVHQGVRPGIVSPLSPDVRSIFLEVCGLTLPSTISVQI